MSDTVLRSSHNTTSKPSSRRWLPLTRMQRMYWSAWSLRPDRPVGNRVLNVEWRFSLEVEPFKRAVQGLIDSMDCFRLVFRESNGQPMQSVLEGVDAELAIMDFSRTSDPYEHATRWLDALGGQPLDIGARNFQTALARLAPDHWIWHLNQHHIATDRTSSLLLIDMLSELYQRTRRTSGPVQSPCPSFFEFLRARPEISASAGTQVDTTGPLPGLPHLYNADAEPASAHSQTRMLRHETSLGKDRSATLAAASGGTPDTPRHGGQMDILLTALAAYVARCGGVDTFTIGVASHNRHVEGADAVAGLIYRIIPVQIELVEGWTFSELHEAVSTQRRKAFANARCGGSIPEARFNVLLNYIPNGLPEFCGTPSRELTATRVAASVGLDLNLTVRAGETPGDIRLLFDLNARTAAITDPAVAATHFLSLLDAALTTPDRRMDAAGLGGNSAIAMARAAARKAVAEPAPPYLCVPEAFLSQAVRTPDAAAITQGDLTLTYAELETRTAAVAKALCQRGVKQGDIVLVDLPRSSDLVVALLSVMRTGAAFCTLDPSMPVERVREIRKSTAARLVIADRTEQTHEDGVNQELLDLKSLATEGEVSDGKLRVIDPAAVMYVIHTSGSTGVPKAIKVSHRSFARCAHWTHGKVSNLKPFSFGFATGLSFEMPLRMFVALISGGGIKVYPGSGAAGETSLKTALADDAVDCIAITPSQLRQLVLRKWDLSVLRTVMVLGEPFPVELARKARTALGPDVDIQNWYGPTEATMASTMHSYDPAQDKGQFVPIGEPAPDVSVHTLDQGMNPVPTGVIGEIFIGGQRLSDGYLNRPDLTAERFIADPFTAGGTLYRTGDLGWRNRKGQIVHHGRCDDQIKINGIRTELSEIEQAVRRHPDVDDCAARFVSRPAERLAVWYTSKKSVPEAELFELLNRFVRVGRNRAYFGKVDALPQTPTGKIDRNALPAVPEQPLQCSGGQPARGETEARIAAIWSDVLGVGAVSRDSDFFEYGGDSLAIVRMILTVEEAFDVDLTIDDFDRMSTVAGLADIVDHLPKRGAVPVGLVPETGLGEEGVAPSILKKLRLATGNWPGAQLSDRLPVYGLNMSGRKPPLFWCFNSEGEFPALAAMLGPDQPIVAVRSLNEIIDDRKDKQESEQRLAALYAAEFAGIVPEGNIFIGGNCQAARIAMKTAQILNHQSDRVRMLCLLETAPPVPYAGRVAMFFGHRSRDHSPFRPYATPELGWRRLYREFTVDVVPGEHGTYFSEPNIRGFCGKLSERISQALQP